MNTSEQLCISFADSVINGNTYNMLELESRKWVDPTVYKEAVELEPPFEEFDPTLPYGTFSSKIKTALPLGTCGEKRFVELTPVLTDKCAYDKCEDVIKTQSGFPYYMIFSVVGNSKDITIYSGVDNRYGLAGFKATWQSVFPGMKIKEIDKDPLAIIADVEDRLLHFADIHASPPYFRCMTGPKEIVSNPVVKFMTLIANLSENETGFLDVMYIPVKNNWYSNINSMIQVSPTIARRLPFPRTMSITQVKSYGNKPLFAVKVRIGCITDDKNVLDSLKSYISQFNYGGLPFRFLTKEDYGKVLSFKKIKGMLKNKVSHTTGMLLSSDELSCFICLPDKSVREYGNVNVNVIENNRVQFRVPDELTGEGRPLGINDYGGVEKTVVLPDFQSNKSLYMIGSSGEGKSTSIIGQILYLKDRYAVIFIDPHDTADDLLGYLGEKDIEKTIYFNPGLEGVIPDYCAFTAKNEADIGGLAFDFCSSFEDIFAGTGTRMMHILGKLAYGAFLIHGNVNTFLILMQRDSEAKALVSLILRKTKNAEVKRFFQNEFWSYKDDAFTPIINRISKLFLDERIAMLYSRTVNKIDIPEIIQKKKLLIVSLPISVLKEDNVGLIGSFLISQVQKAALAQGALPKNLRSQVVLVVDEFHVFPAYKVMASIINTCRKFGLHICLSHQVSSQVPDGILKTLCSINMMCFRVNIDDARRMAPAFGVSPADIMNLDVGEVYGKLANRITSLSTPPPKKEDFSEEMKQRIIDYNIKHYYTPVSELQKKSSPKQREYDVF